MVQLEDASFEKRLISRERGDMDESAEIEVVKAILLREEYIKRIKANLISQGSKFGKDQGAFGDLLGLFDLLRLTTVDTCEAIQQWRKRRGSPSMPFIWKSMNYLLKVPIDLNFLDNHKLLRTWIGFSLRRNPFMCPVPLEKLAGVSNAANTSGQRVFSVDKKGFFSVGGSTNLKPRTRDTLGGESRTPSSLRVGRSVIADGDMERIRGAAAMILHEEATHGRYTADNSRFVPAGTAEKLKFSRRLKLDDNRGIHMAANVSQELAPFTDMAEIGHTPDDISPGDIGELSTSIDYRRDLASSVAGLPSYGKASAKRAGGRLRPVTVLSTPPRKRAPVIRRSVGAMLRAEMLHRQQQNIQLQEELENLRQQLWNAQSASAEQRPTESLCLKFPQEIDVPHDNTSDSRGPDRLADTGEAASKIERKAEELKRRMHRQATLEEQLRILQAKERDRENKRRAKVLERKRRLLEHDPGLLQPRVDDEYTLEDEAATRIQRIARGVQGRARVRKLRPVLNNAATKIQAIIRGRLGRSRVELEKVDKRSVTNIQRVWRGYRGRCATVSNRRTLERTAAARNIQKIARGRCGRRRVDHKRGLRESAKNGAEVVGVKQLFHQDIVELADAVDALVMGQSGATSLPGVVLGLLKVVALMLEEDEESAETTRYSALGVKSIEKVQPALHFSWRDALSLLRRSNKLLRRLRQVAEGPASRRSRIVFFSQAAVRAYAALRCDQGWNLATIGRVGRGAKACQHLMMWVDALQEVFAFQREFADDLGSDRMPWVARAQQSLRCMRHLELSRMVWEHAVICVQHILHESQEAAPKEREHLPATGDCSSRRGDLRLCVAESALKTLRARENCANDALCRMKNEEEEAQRNDEAREQLREETLAEDLSHAEANLAKSLTRLEEAKTAARDGIETDQVHLQLLLDELATCEVVRRERWTSLEMFRTQRRRNDKRRGLNVEVWGNLRHQLRVVGELEAASFIATEDLNFLRGGSDSDGSTGPAGSRSHELELLQVRVNEAQSLATAAQTRLLSMEEEQENAQAIASEAELHKEETVLPHEWDDATEEEREEDLREDEQCARWEANTATQFVPPAMIARPFQRPRPMIICLSRDVPGTAKKKIVRQLESDLPGLTVHIDDNRNMGLHVGDLQQALSSRYSVVCHVDVGIGTKRRNAFLQRLTTVREVLIPTPNFILVVGDGKNRSGGPLDSSVGCAGHDLSVMGDGEIKKRLEDVARIAIEIQDPIFLEAMANMGQPVAPPSHSHVLVMEALIILLTPRTVFHNHIPFSSLKGVTWSEARHILGHPDKLAAAVARVDACQIPPVNLSTLQVYIGHDRWPPSVGNGGALEILGTWVRSTIEISVLLTRAGGSPEPLCHYSKAHAGLLAAVVPVQDEYCSIQLDPKRDFKRGWRPAYNQALTALLEDVRVFRVAKKIRGSQADGVHLIEIYQECGRLFFHTYDPDSCVSSFCVIEETQISHLLAPTLDQPPEFGPSSIPCDRQDMFERLVALLSFEPARSNDTVGVSHLTCQRRLRRLMRDTRQISGHVAQVSVYEEAKGQLRYSLYLAEHAARIQLNVDASLLEKVLQDSSDKTGERQAITSEDTGRLLVPITDRLGIHPSRTAVSTMGASRGSHERKAPSQGFILKVRHKGGPGRRVLRVVCLISGTCHVLSAWELGRGGLLRLAAYDPTTSMTYEASLSKAERACFDFEGEDRKSWINQLGRRLSLRRAHGTSEAENLKGGLQPRRTMILDKTVFSTACRVATGRIDTHLFRLRAELVGAGRFLAIDLYQAETSKQCRILLDSDDLVAVGLEPHTGNADGEQGDASDSDKMTSMLVGPRRRETVMRQLTRQLRFDPESDSVTFSVNGEPRTAALATTNAVEHRRPQSSVKSAFLQPAANPGSYKVGHYGLVEGFLKRRRQPCVLRHGHRRAHSQECVGKTRVAATTAPREASKRKKGKQKRDKKHTGPVDEGGKQAAAPSETSGRNIRENIETRTDAYHLLQDDWEEHQPVCDTVVTVFESSRPGTGDGPGMDINLRAAVYYPKLAAYAEVSIKGFQDLRQVVGALHQALAHEWRHQPKDDGAADDLFNFIFHHRAKIVVGMWDGDRDGYFENGTDFTVLLKRSRLYRSFKQTPVHLSGIKDEQANAHQLIDDRSRRGKKVFRRAVNVSSTLFQVTAYEVPAPEARQGAAPTLRFIAYDPKTQVQLIAVIHPDAVLELGGGPHSPWMAEDKREVLAEILAEALRLKTGHDGPPTLILPWSGENLAFVDEVQPGETSRPRRDKVLACAKREGLSKLEVFSTRVTNYEVVITVFAETNALSPLQGLATQAQDSDTEDGEGPTLNFNLYCPKLSQSVDIDLPHAMQKLMTGRSILRFPKGEARSSAIRRSARFLCITSPTSSEGLQAEFLFAPQKPWLVAYNELDASDRPSTRRPRGQPLIFIPGDTDGDLIVSKGISINGFRVLLSVHTKERGRPGREGLVLEVYNAETSASSILHLSASHLLKQVDEKDHLLEDGRLLETIDMLTKRLLLKKSATGEWELRMDVKLTPFLFMGM